MRKLFYFLALSAIVLGMASCGNEPEMDALQIEVKPLSTQVMVCITPADNKAPYAIWAVGKAGADDEGGIDQYIADFVAAKDYDEWSSSSTVREGPNRIIMGTSPESTYYAIACLIAKDEETGKAKIVGKPRYALFTTLPANTLNGEFSVSATKKVHFSSGNAYQTEAGFTIRIQEEQWKRYGSTQSYPRDLFQWGTTKMLANTFFIPSSDEWYYLFRERDRADELFAHAKVNDVDGLIILPDDWKEPEDYHVKSCKEMEMEWDEATHTYAQGETFDGYAQNVFGYWEWKILEFYGAVFLPFTWEWSGMNVAWYWSATESAESAIGAHALNFNKYWLYLRALKATSMEKTGSAALRPVRVVE